MEILDVDVDRKVGQVEFASARSAHRAADLLG
jgi:hypothetical protein